MSDLYGREWVSFKMTVIFTERFALSQFCQWIYRVQKSCPECLTHASDFSRKRSDSPPTYHYIRTCRIHTELKFIILLCVLCLEYLPPIHSIEWFSHHFILFCNTRSMVYEPKRVSDTFSLLCSVDSTSVICKWNSYI